MGGAAHEVAATLNALEGKLRELERELLGTTAGDHAGAAPADAAPAAQVPVPPGGGPLSPRAVPPPPDPLTELVAFRDLLERSANTLIGEYDRLLERLRAGPLGVAGQGEQTFEGHVTIEAGPFPDVANLLAFERGVLAVPGAHDARVSSYDGSTAAIHALLAQPVALVTELRRLSPLPFTVVGSQPGALVLQLSSGA